MDKAAVFTKEGYVLTVEDNAGNLLFIRPTVDDDYAKELFDAGRVKDLKFEASYHFSERSIIGEFTEEDMEKLINEPSVTSEFYFDGFPGPNNDSGHLKALTKLFGWDYDSTTLTCSPASITLSLKEGVRQSYLGYFE